MARAGEVYDRASRSWVLAGVRSCGPVTTYSTFGVTRGTIHTDACDRAAADGKPRPCEQGTP